MRLLLCEREDGSVEQGAERVVIKLAHWHLTILRHLVWVLDQFCQVVEHLFGIAASEDLPVLLPLLLFLFLVLGVESDFAQKFFILRSLLFRKVHFDLRQLRSILEHLDESGLTLTRPVLLMIFRLLKAQILQRCIISQQPGHGLKARVRQHSNVQLLDVCVQIACLNNPGQTDALEANALE